MSHSTKWKRFSAALALTVALGGCDVLAPRPPSMIVLVVVDQLRADLLDRYDSLFTGGFRRLREQGLRYSRATHDHAATVTCAGHATLATGVYPSGNGIVANDWLERTPGGWKSVYCFEDPSSHILGFPAMEGRSPVNLLRDGFSDWLLASDSRAIVVSVSRKDRGAIGLAGRSPGHVYWITESQGRFVTSSHYRAAYPGWVERFNLEEMPRIFGDSVWEQTMPPTARTHSRRDTVEYEGDGEHTFFPHRFLEETGDPGRSGALKRWAYAQVYPDEAVAAFGIEAVREIGMGKDDVTDYLALSFSQTDAIGHDYGPLSREQLENLLHLDRLLGRVMDVLNEEVGEGRWVMALTADHGVMTIPEYLAELGEAGRRLSPSDLSNLREIFSDHRELGGDPMERASVLTGELEALPFVGDAFSVAEMTGGPPADSFVVLVKNSFHPERWHWGYGSEGSGVLFRFAANVYPSSSPRGTGHGSPYYYDRHVPLIFYGSGVEGGMVNTPVRTVDVAPTLARLAGIPVPPEIDGVALVH